MTHLLTRKIFVCVIAIAGVMLAPRLYGQSKIIDSLEQKLNGKLGDTLRIKTLQNLAREYQYTNLQKSISLLEEAVKLAEDKNLAKSKASSYGLLATFLQISGDYGASAKYNDLALSIYFQLKDSLGISRSYNNLGQDFIAFGKYDEAYFYHTQSYRFSSNIKDSLGMAVALHNIGTIFKYLGQYDKALDYFALTQKISDEIEDHEGKAYNYDESGDVYRRKGMYDSALSVLNASLIVSKSLKLKFNDLLPATFIKIAKTYLATGAYAKALSYYDSAKVLFQKSDNEFGIAEVNLGRATVLIKEKKYAEAQKLIEASLVVAQQTHSWTLEIDCNETLSNLHELKGEYAQALKYYKNFKQLEDSLFSQGMEAKLLQDQIRFEMAAKEDQIKALTRLEDLRTEELRKQELVRNILVVVVALVVILLFTVYRSGQRRIRINKLLMEHQDEIKKRSEELAQLNQVKDKFFSIISHDLRSPMNALSAILNMMDNDQIKPEEFSKLNKELRVQFNHTKTLINNLLDWTLLQMDKLKIQSEKIDLSVLVDDNFKLLNSMNSKETSLINKVASGTFCHGDLNMLSLVLRNLVLNAIKFTESGGKVEVDASITNNELVVSVKDNGIGISPEVQKILFEKTSGYSTRGTANEKGTGLGLILCKEFVEKNGGRIWLESEIGKGSTFYFTIKKA
jgi:signal transduction histidine kinase